MFLIVTVALGSSMSPAQMRISQVYGGGGNSGATYTHDFIELLNAGSAIIDLSGWSVRYASATGSTWQMTVLSGIVQPMHYLLIQEAPGGGGTSPLPTPDISGSIAMSATAGKVVLMSSQTTITTACPVGMDVVDLVGFGSTANCFEGDSAAPSPASKLAIIRKGGGREDSNNNGADFLTGAPDPRNSGATPVFVRDNSSDTGSPVREPALSSYPNPFNSSTRLLLELPRTGQVSLTLVNLLGETVRTLHQGQCEAGGMQIVLDGTTLPSGIYYCLLRTEGSLHAHRLVLLR